MWARLLAASFALASLSVPVAAVAEPGRNEGAISYAAKARAAYERGEFRDAVKLYEEAFALEPDPTLQFNLGRCYEALATMPDLRAAVAKYEAYLAATPPAVSDRAAVQRRVDALRKRIRLLEKAAQPAPSEPSERAPRTKSSPSPWPWVIGGTGVLGVVVGAVLGAEAIRLHDEAVDSPSGLDAMDLEAEYETVSISATATLVASGAFVIAGLTWGLVDLAATGHIEVGALVTDVGIGGFTVSGRF